MSDLTLNQVDRLAKALCQPSGHHKTDWPCLTCVAAARRTSHIVVEILAEQRESIAQEIQDMGPVWGGDRPWMTTGTRVADLVASLIIRGAP